MASKGFAWLQYLEAVYMRASRLDLSASLRGSIFCIDEWQDRIYCYERDLPGCFSVPAYYGRGYALSALTGVKYRHHKVNVRLSLINYERRTTFLRRTELKLQYQFDF